MDAIIKRAPAGAPATEPTPLATTSTLADATTPGQLGRQAPIEPDHHRRFHQHADRRLGRPVVWIDAAQALPPRLISAPTASASREISLDRLARRTRPLTRRRLAQIATKLTAATDFAERVAFQKSLQTRQRLLADNPTSAAAARDVSFSHWQLMRLHAQAENEVEAQRHAASCFAILDAFHREGRPMDPAMRQIHQHLAGLMETPSKPREDGAELPDALVRHIFADPQADALLRKVMADNGLDGTPADLPLETQRAIVAMLMKAGVIQLSGGEGTAER